MLLLMQQLMLLSLLLLLLLPLLLWLLLQVLPARFLPADAEAVQNNELRRHAVDTNGNPIDAERAAVGKEDIRRQVVVVVVVVVVVQPCFLLGGGCGPVDPCL